MSKLPDWMPDDEEIAGVIRGECWDAGGGDSRRAARAIRELLERKAGEPDGKSDPAPVASETCAKGDHCFVDNTEPSPADPFACKHCGETTEVCEGCSEPATLRDVEGVPLCKECYAECECADADGEDRP